jgi:hypothetical protein
LKPGAAERKPSGRSQVPEKSKLPNSGLLSFVLGFCTLWKSICDRLTTLSGSVDKAACYHFGFPSMAIWVYCYPHHQQKNIADEPSGHWWPRDQFVCSRPLLACEATMMTSDRLPPPGAFDRRPICVHCGFRMTLVRIIPDRPGYDQRTYECSRCDREVMEVVKYRRA